MTNINWPAELPQYFLLNRYRMRPADTVHRSQMEFGRPKQRVRDVATYVYVNGVLRMTVAQTEVFEGFWNDTIGSGVLPFNWVHPMKRYATVCEFIEDYQQEAQGPHILVSVGMMVFL